MFVCLNMVHFFFFPLAAKLIGPRMECQFFKNVVFFFFFVEHPLKHCQVLLSLYFFYGLFRQMEEFFFL